MVATGVGPLFTAIEDSIALFGPYDRIKRVMSHYIIGALITPSALRLGNITTDARVHLVVSLRTGHGKRELKGIVQEFTEAIPGMLRMAEPSSLHAEQLVGKRVTRGTGEEGEPHYKDIPGHLAADFLALEEAHEYLGSRFASAVRKYLKVALDPWPSNWIEKRLVSHEEGLRYRPPCSVLMLTQPHNLPPEVWWGGLARRFLWVPLDPLTREQDVEILRMAVRKDLLASGGAEIAAKAHDLVAARKGVTDVSVLHFDFRNVAEAALTHAEECYTLAEDSQLRLPGLASALKFSIFHLLLKFAANYRAARFRWSLTRSAPVDAADVEMAMDDLRDLVPSMVHYLDQHLTFETVPGELSQAVVAFLLRKGPQYESQIYLGLSDKLGRYSKADVARALSIMLAFGHVRFTEDLRYEVGAVI